MWRNSPRHESHFTWHWQWHYVSQIQSRLWAFFQFKMFVRTSTRHNRCHEKPANSRQLPTSCLNAKTAPFLRVTHRCWCYCCVSRARVISMIVTFSFSFAYTFPTLRHKLDEAFGVMRSGCSTFPKRLLRFDCLTNLLTSDNDDSDAKLIPVYASPTPSSPSKNSSI